MTANITYRSATAGTPPGSTTNKNAPLTNAEIDGNFKSILNDIDAKAPIDSPTFTTAANAPTPTTNDNSTKIATTAFVQSSIIPLRAASTAGAFDQTATTPTSITRLNYAGVFWPTSINLTGTADTAAAATNYFVETTSDGVVRPKLLSDVKTEIVTNAAVNSAAATTVGTVTSGTWNASTVGVLYGGTGQTTAQGAMNVLAGAVTTGQYLRGNGTNVTLSAIQAAEVPVLNQDTTGTATNAINLNGSGSAKTAASAGSGYGLWNSGAITYGTMMALSTDVTYGGRNGTESTSDYNMYFTMNGGTNRGFVFRSAFGTNLFSINPDGVRTGLAVTGTSFNSITGLSSAVGAADTSTGTIGVATTVSRSDHAHPFPTATNVGLGNVTNESKATMFTNAAFTGTTTGITSAMVGLGNVTNESKATMFTGPALTGTATAVNLTITGDLTVSGTTTAINATNLNVADLNITIGSGAINATQANGAGLTIGNYASNPTLLYGSASDNFTFNRAVLGSSFNAITGLSAAVGAATAASGSVGTSTAAARADHVHPWPTPANIGAEVPLTFTGGAIRTANTINVALPTTLPTTNAVTFTNTGGAALGTTFNGSSAITVSYATIGAQAAGSYEAPLTFSGGVSRSVNAISITYGTAASTVCQGNDSRLSDARPAAGGTADALNTANGYTVANITTNSGSVNANNGANSWQFAGYQSGTLYGRWGADSTACFRVLNAAATTWVMTLDNSGNAVFAANVTAYSDIRYKTNIVKITGALDKVDQLNGYTFDRTDINTSRQTGVIAQEVLKVLPEAVMGTEDTQYSVAYGNMVGLLIEAIKELRAEVAELRGMK